MKADRTTVEFEKRPLITFFLQPYPFGELDEQQPTATYSPDRKLNVTPDGTPLYCAGRAKKPYTSAVTPGHTIKAGYTPSGKYKPAKFVPTKTDKRAGK